MPSNGKLRHQTASDSYFIETDAGVVTAGEEFTLSYSIDPDEGSFLFIESDSERTLLGSIDAPVSLAGNDEAWTLGASQYSSPTGTASDLRSYLDGSISDFEIVVDELVF